MTEFTNLMRTFYEELIKGTDITLNELEKLTKHKSSIDPKVMEYIKSKKKKYD